MSKPIITKKVVECYQLRGVNQSSGWADITIDAAGSRGRVSISSDYGSYQNYWNSCGKPFKKFLLDLNMEYAADKFGADRHFDHAGTMEIYRLSVLERRRSEGISKEKARKVWDEIKSLNTCWYEEDFKSKLNECSNLLAYFDWCPEFSRGVTPRFKKFWKECWLVLCEELKKEIQGEVNCYETIPG